MRKPNPIFEVIFQGPGIYPEKIPLGMLTQTLSAIRRLAAGNELEEDEEEQELGDDSSIRLLDVQRSSAVFRFVGQSPTTAIQYLRQLGKALDNPEEIAENDYIIRPVERLSATARRLDCSILVRESKNPDVILAKIEPTSYERMSQRLFITGDTSITGKVQRVGGATQVRCALRVSFQSRLLYCLVENVDLARKLGDHLYQDVAVHGTASWIKNTWRIVEFTITSIHSFKKVTISEALESLHESGGKGWDEVEDPERYLSEVSGK
jgi:hypothetical protein